MFELIVKTVLLDNRLRHTYRKENPVRTLGPVAFLLLILVSSSFAATTVVKSSVVPEPGVLALLGSGLVGIAAFIRRHFTN
jgi:hypothetical protein